MAPLHTACKKGDIAGVQAAISAGADVNQLDSGGNAPLVWATYSGNAQAVELLLRHGADPLVKYKAGWSLLHICAKEHLPTVAQVLLRFGADVTATNDSGRLASELAKGEVRAVLESSLADERATRHVATQKRQAELAALAQVEAALARSARLDGDAQGGSAPGAPPRPGAPGLTPAGYDALAVAAKRKAAQESDALAREALEEADLLRTLAPTQGGALDLPGVPRAAPPQHELSDLQARVASRLRAVQHQMAGGRDTAAAGVAPARLVAQPAAAHSAYGIPSLLAASQPAPVAAPAPQTAGLAPVRVQGLAAQPAASNSREPDSPSTPSSARRALLSPEELAKRAQAAAASSRAPMPTQQLDRMRKAAEEAVQQRSLRGQHAQDGPEAAAHQPISSVRSAAKAARSTPTPAVVRLPLCASLAFQSTWPCGAVEH
jgi:hypothetical protein